MTASPATRGTGPERASAVRRLASARGELVHLDAACAAAGGTGEAALAQRRLSAGRADVAARKQWLHWIDAGESLAPWADGEWAAEAAAGVRAEQPTSVGHDLRLIRARISQGEADLDRAIAATAARIEALNVRHEER